MEQQGHFQQADLLAAPQVCHRRANRCLLLVLRAGIDEGLQLTDGSQGMGPDIIAVVFVLHARLR